MVKYKMAATIKSSTVLLIFVSLSTVTAQTFQYSRGWINGKRSGHRNEDAREVVSSLEKIFTPCQINKLKYILEGKPVDEKLFAPCAEYLEEENDSKQKKMYRMEQSQEPLYEAFL